MLTEILVVLLVGPQGSPDSELTRLEEWSKTQPENGPGKVGIGDEYFKSSKKFPKDRQRFMDRANEAWAAGWPLLDSFWRGKTRENLKKIYAAPQAPARQVVGWSQGQFVKAEISSAAVRTGVGALRFIPSKQSPGLVEGVKLTVKLQAGREYVFSFWSMSDGTDGNESSVLHVYDATGREVATKTGTHPNDTPVWTETRWVLTTPAGTDHADFIFLTSSKSGSIYIDDVSLKLDGKETIQNGGFEGR